MWGGGPFKGGGFKGGKGMPMPPMPMPPPAYYAPPPPMPRGGGGMRAGGRGFASPTGTWDVNSGVVFMCNSDTRIECEERLLFGAPAGRQKIISAISDGTPLFLFDISKRIVVGGFVANGGGGMNLEPAAWDGKYPAQVHVRVQSGPHELPEKSVQHLLTYTGPRHFRMELTQQQVNGLQKAMGQPVSGPVAPAKKQNQAGSSAGPEKRRDPTDPDGNKKYTRAEFIKFYGPERGQERWEQAAPGGAKSLLESDDAQTLLAPRKPARPEPQQQAKKRRRLEPGLGVCPMCEGQVELGSGDAALITCPNCQCQAHRDSFAASGDAEL
eukprot:TRINITY_DN14059_c0_g1_i1.p1 TRINITY_DN14059_c0_g1~~TRINITY_DN14059_c0_g1_i1.p1  ORF type:complete len:326 (+),score=87.00 TRINITY_DN14059_c0_g1_i1:95-1072(+)